MLRHDLVCHPQALYQDLQVKTEFVVQDKKDGQENAGYLALNYNFLSSKYTPSLGYRFS
ncbi:hypothetical protein IAF21_18810, partial [Acinetobacter baumannii]|nr:hypothetical protein [Acinetobacter baumannii]